MSHQNSPNPKTVISSYSLPTDLVQPLKDVIALTGLKYLSELLTVIASNPDAASAALRPLAMSFVEVRDSAKVNKASRLALADQLKHLSSDQVRALLEAVKVVQ